MMQVIYLDTLICVNLFIDYLLLVIIRKHLHINCKSWRVILGAVFGGISTTAIFLPFYNTVFSIIYTPLIAAVTVIISYGYGGIRKLFIRTLTYIGAGMLLCACVLIIELMWNPAKVLIYNNVLYFDISPVLLILSTTAVYIALNLYRKISEKNKLRYNIRTVTIEIDDKKYTFESMVDTGCNLKEPFSGLDVIIAEKEIISGINVPSESTRIIPFSTASGSGLLTGFRPKKVFIDGKEVYKGCYIGVCQEKIHGEIKSLMSAELSEAVI